MQLKKELNLLHVFSISTGAMISSGLFVLPGLAYAKAGPAMILAYLVAAILIIPSMLAKAELSTAMPKAGGTYFFTELIRYYNINTTKKKYNFLVFP